VKAVRKPVLACAILLTLSLFPVDRTAGAGDQMAGALAPVWSLSVPGGTAALAEAAGLDQAMPRARLMLAVIRVIHEWLPGVDARADASRQRVLDHVRAADSSSPGAGGETVPSPLPLHAWRVVAGLGPGAPESLLGRILGSREASLAYFGLAAMDGPTREYLAATSDALAALTDPSRAPLLALYGRSLRVRGGSVDVPGGTQAVALWEDLAGAPATQPAAFFSRVMEKDGGRLALLYDAVAHLHPPAQAFVLGLPQSDAALPTERRSGTKRLERFRALYRATGAALVAWNPREQPFDRGIFDAAQVLSQTTVLPGGRLAGPAWRPFWAAVFAPGKAGQPVRVQGPVSAWEPVDAAWLVEQVCVTSITARRQRAEAWAFAQRVFPSPSPESLPDVFVAVQGLARFQMLVLTLERMGIADPATYATAVRTAEKVARLDGYRAWAAVTQFQSAIAFIERTRFARAISAAEADRLVRSVCAVPTTREGDYAGGMAAWLERWLLSSNGAPTDAAARARPDRPIEAQLLAVIAGAVTTSPFAGPSQIPTVEWEGLRYRVDPSAATLRRLLAVRDAQGGPPLDAVLALLRKVSEVLSDSDRTQVLGRASALAAGAAQLRVPGLPGGEGKRAEEPDLHRGVENLRVLLLDRTLKATRADLELALQSIRRELDWYVAAVLCSIVYAPHLGPAGSPALLGGDPSLRHELGIGDARLDIRADGPWQPPAEVRDKAVGWRVTGSLLGLDLALGRLSLRRVPSEEMPPAPRLTDVERKTVVEPIVLLSPFDQSDVQLARLAESLAGGRARLAEAAASDAALRRLAGEVGLDEWRLQMLGWMREHEAGRIPELWSLGELAGLGVPAGASTAGFDAFGASQWSLRGEPACRFLRHQPWTTLAGRKGSGMVPALVPDLMMAVADSLAAQRLPARLLVGVLSVAAQDLLDHVRVSHADDWPGLVAEAQRVVRGRLEDYVAALTSDGPLIPLVQEPRDVGR